MKKWRAWDLEYPEVGSIEIEAPTLEDARKIALEKMMDIPEEYIVIQETPTP